MKTFKVFTDCHIKRSLIKRQASGILSDNEWQRVVQRVKTNDIEWQRMTTSVTTNDNEWDNEWQRVTTSDNEWQRATTSDHRGLSGVSGPSITFAPQKTFLGFLVIVYDRWVMGKKFSYKNVGLERPRFHATVT